MKNSPFINNDALAKLYPAHVSTLKDRFDKVLDKVGAQHAVIFAGGRLPVFLDDYPYPFKTNPHFISWLPLPNLPHSYLVYSGGGKPRLIYFQEKDYWHATPEDPVGYWTPFFDIQIVHELSEIAEHMPEDRDRCIFVGDVQDDAQAMGIERINPTRAMNVLHFRRGVKTEYEIECMRQASQRSARGHVAAEAAFRNGRSEFAINQAYCGAVSHADNELPYGNIVALNEHAAILHYQHLDREPPETIRSFLIDAGAQIHRYAADITRSYAYDDSEFAELLEQFDALQLALVDKVRAGIDYSALHIEAHRLIAAFLTEHGFAEGSAEALIVSGVTSAFYPHGLGHLLGAQVHDAGGFMADEDGTTIDRPDGHPYLRLTRILQADMVLTIEPGLYVIDMLLENLRGSPGFKMLKQDRIDWLRPFGGIRIEDDVRVLSDSCENLTRDAFAGL